MSMKKYVGILKSRELVIQKQFLHEKKKKTKSFAGATWYFSWSPHRLATDAPLFSTPSVAPHARSLIY